MLDRYENAVGLVFESVSPHRGKHRPTWRVVGVARDTTIGPHPMFVLERVDANSRAQPPGSRRRMTVRVFEGFTTGAWPVKFRRVDS